MESLKQDYFDKNQNIGNAIGHHISNESDQGNVITDRQENFQCIKTHENFQHDNEIYTKSSNTPYLNYGIFSKDGIYNDDTNQKTKSQQDLKLEYSEQSKISSEEKPWQRASRDHNIIQKGTELFVGNLSMDTNEEDIHDNFREFGDIVDVKTIIS